MITVWAPKARRMELETGGRRVPMTATGDGWWAADDPGGDYAFVIDGGAPRPDPRSAWQPHGIHGPSRRVDHAAYAWRDGGWQPPAWENAIVYELHIGTFTPAGTFPAAIERLDHLTRLGITHVELMPVQEFSGRRGWGYDGVDLFAPHHAYGTPDELKQLVDACHARGLAVLLDVVYNHLGPAGNYLGEFAPYFTERYATPWGPAVNLDGPGSDQVRRFICDNAGMWLRDYHFDGLRIDAVHALLDSSAVHLLEQLAGEVAALQAQLGRRLLLIAESDLNDPRLVRRAALGGYGLDAQWSDDFHHALHAVLSGERQGYYADFAGLADLATALRQAYVYAGRYSAFRDRSHGRPAAGLSGHAFLGYLQNHDQIGNRARGERSIHLMSRSRAKIAAALVLTAPFVPLLFQGEEWGASSPFQYFTAHEDKGLARRVRDGRRHEFARFNWRPEDIPDPQDEATFLRSKLQWPELEKAEHAEMLNWHRALIALRRDTPALRNGRMDLVRTRFDETAGWLIVERGTVTVACNLSDRAQTIPLTPSPARTIKLASAPAVLREREIDLPPESIAVA